MSRNLSRFLILSLALAPWLCAQEPPVAFVDVSVVPMDKEEILPHQTVIVEGRRIVRVGPSPSVKVPRKATRIEGKGKFLMPGLADMHVHFVREAAHSWVCPTMVVDDLPRTDSTWLDEASYVPPAVFDRYRTMYPHQNIDPRTAPRGHAVDMAIVAALHSGRVALLLGTDALKPGTLPGFSLHEELEKFVAAGMTPYEAIRAGTADAAQFLHQNKEFGVVTAGTRADLLLLNANPLEDVKNTSKIAGVMAMGRWLTTEDLTHRLATLRSSYQH